jgi:predicted benzoate:H+ symporter BenE
VGQESKLSLTEETRSGVLRTFLLSFLAGIFVSLPRKLPLVAAWSSQPVLLSKSRCNSRVVRQHCNWKRE